MQEIHEPKHVGALGPQSDRGLAAGGQGVLGARQGRAHRPAQPAGSRSRRCCSRSRCGWCGRWWSAKLPAIGFTYTTDQLFWLAALPGLSGATLRIFYSFMVPIFGGRLLDHALHLRRCSSRRSASACAVQNPATPYWLFLALALLCGFGGGNFASSMANISFFFPKAREGQRAGAQCRPRQPRRQRGAVRRCRSSITAGVFGCARRRPATSASADGRPAVAAERRLHLGAVHRRQRLRRLVRHERHRLAPRPRSPSRR